MSRLLCKIGDLGVYGNMGYGFEVYCSGNLGCKSVGGTYRVVADLVSCHDGDSGDVEFRCLVISLHWCYYFLFGASYFGPWHLLVIHVWCEPSSDDTRINLYCDASCLTDCPTWCVPSTYGVWLILLICWHFFHGFFWSDM